MTTFETTSDPLHGTNFLLFFVFPRFLPPWPKNAPKPMEKTKKQKTKTCFTPCHLSSFSSDPLHGSKLFFLFFFGFSRFLPLCQSNNISCSFFCVFCFPVSSVPGRNFHPDKHPLAQLSPLHMLY